MKEEITQVLLDKIDFRPQVRETFDEQLLNGLAKNIEEIGLEHPVILFKDGERFGIIDGERRCRAKKLRGDKTVPAIVKEKPPEAQLLLRQISCDFHRQDLAPLEKAAAIGRLMEATGWKGNEVAARLGVSPAMVTRLLSLLTLPEPIRQALKEGAIPASGGFELAKIEDVAIQHQLAQKLMAGEITRDGVAGARKAAKRGEEKLVKRVTARLERGRTITVAAATLDEFIAALEEALSKARKGRNQGVALSTFISLLKDKAA